MSKIKDQNKHSKKIQMKAGQETLAPEKVIEILKSEILAECREVARGAKVTIYEMIEKTKELMSLEEAQKPSETPKPEQF